MPALAQLTPPKTRITTVEDRYFDKTVQDNYRWLENVSAPDVKEWVMAQGEYTKRLLDRIPGRDSLISTLTGFDRMQPERYSAIKRRAGRYFFRKTMPGENIGKLYYKQGEHGAEILLFDPSTYQNGKGYYMLDHLPSHDGKMVAIAIANGGGEIATLRVIDVGGNKFLSDKLSPVREEFTWAPDSRGIIYTVLNSADPFDVNFQMNTQACYHALGTNPQNDRVILSASKNPELGISKTEVPTVYVSNDLQHLIGNLMTVDYRMHVVIAPITDLAKAKINWKPLISREDSIAGLTDVGGQLFLHSIKGAPNGRVLVTSLASPDVRVAKVAVAEGNKIYEIGASKDYLLITKDDVVRSYLQTYHAATRQLHNIPLPVSGVGGIRSYDPQANDLYVSLVSWLYPPVTYNYSPPIGKLTPSTFHRQSKYPGLDQLTVEEIEIPGHDGTLIPLSIIYRKGLKKDGSTVCFMTGYGAYGHSATPHFDPKYLALLNQGVIVAVTHPRGGSEKGLSWYKAGFKTTKPNTWKDFISSGEYLIRAGYTSARHLIGEGTSAGGILIGRAITERPDLFAAAINNVGVTNVMRFELTPNSDNIAEFGTFKDSVESKALYEMDALYHVKKGTPYPAVISVGGMNDPRVIIWQPGKFTAALQNSTSSGKPVLLQVNYDNGHFTEDKTVTFRNFANMYAFALWQAGHPGFKIR
ncbi:prolyl oligopeptidase family serine peptidase [Mucilaginibacter gynuensis]|uniref:prolyl oligopeptidase n=2 Tax=Mucilaginibacter gynuensis TaxID=1302236 RepID=A0ABP8GRH3_9SPHI